jgi:hypothetical protein
MNLRPLLLAMLAVHASACGARSSLLDLAGSPPDGGTVEPPECTPLTPAGPPVTVPDVVGFDALRPAMVPLAGGPEAAVVFALHPPMVSEPAPQPISDVTLDPWGAWPPAVSTPHQVAGSGGEVFFVAPRDDSAYALFADGGPGGVPLFATSVDPAGEAVFSPLDMAGAPRLLARSGAFFLRAVEYGDDSDPNAAIRWLSTFVTYGEMPYIWTINCGLDSLVGDAIPYFGTGFLAIVTNQVANASCVSSGGMFQSGPAAEIQLRGYPLDGTETLPPAIIPFDDPVDRVRLLRRSQGAWALVQTRSAGGATGHVEVIGVNAAGSPDPALPPVEVAPAGTFGFAAAPLGDGFALAWVDPAGAIGVATFDASRTKLASTSIPIAGPASVTDPVSILTKKDASEIVVAWSERSPGAGARVRLTRLGCLSGG